MVRDACNTRSREMNRFPDPRNRARQSNSLQQSAWAVSFECEVRNGSTSTPRIHLEGINRHFELDKTRAAKTIVPQELWTVRALQMPTARVALTQPQPDDTTVSAVTIEVDAPMSVLSTNHVPDVVVLIRRNIIEGKNDLTLRPSPGNQHDQHHYETCRTRHHKPPYSGKKIETSAESQQADRPRPAKITSADGRTRYGVVSRCRHLKASRVTPPAARRTRADGSGTGPTTA